MVYNNITCPILMAAFSVPIAAHRIRRGALNPWRTAWHQAVPVSESSSVTVMVSSEVLTWAASKKVQGHRTIWPLMKL